MRHLPRFLRALPILGALGVLTAGLSHAAAPQASDPPPTALSAWGQWGGETAAIVYRAPHLYATLGPRVVTLDARDPLRPRELGASDNLGGELYALAAAGEHLLVSVYSRGASELVVLDARDPARLPTVSRLGLSGAALRLAERDGYVYIAGENGMSIVSLRDPTRPRHVASFGTDSTVLDIDLGGTVAYLTLERVTYYWPGGGAAYENHRGVLAVDLSDPERPRQPVLLNQYIDASHRPIMDIEIRADVAWVIDVDGRLARYGLGDLHALKLLGREAVSAVGGSHVRLFVAGDWAFVVHPPADPMVTLVNIAQPDKPRVVADIWHGSPGAAWSELQLLGDRLLLGSSTGGYDLIELTAPGGPALRSPYAPLGSVHAVAVVGDSALVLRRSGGLRVLDLRSPGLLREVARVDTPPHPMAMAVANGYAYIASQADASGLDHLTIVDVRSPAAPLVRARIELAPGVAALAVAGNRLFAAGSDLTIFDISQPTVPVQLGRLPLVEADGAWGVAVRAGTAYLFGPRPWVNLVDVSDPAAPAHGPRYRTADSVSGMAFRDRYAYLTLRHARVLEIVDVGLPQQPLHLRRIAEVGSAVDIVIDGDLAWVAGWYGLQVFDVRDSAAPDRLQSWVLPASGPLLALAGQRVITGGPGVGVSAWNFQRAARWPTPRPTLPPSTPTVPTASPTLPSPTPTEPPASPTAAPTFTPLPTATALPNRPLRHCYLPIVLWQAGPGDWPTWPKGH